MGRPASISSPPLSSLCSSEQPSPSPSPSSSDKKIQRNKMTRLRLTARTLVAGLRKPVTSGQCQVGWSLPPTRGLHRSLPLLQQPLPPSPSIAESNLKSCNLFQPEVVIFDKDGTLVCFHTMWNSWCEQLAQRMNAETDRELSEEVYRLMGYDSEKREIGMGMLAEKTHPYIRDKVVEMLVAQGFSQWEATEVMEKTWKDTPENMQIKETGNLRALFVRLKERGIKIAICTSDSREGTIEFLERMGLESMVDIIVCGDDEASKSKPDPHNAKYICEQLGVKCSEAIMVGDTPADTIMGQAANLGLTIGVLTGVGSHQDLVDADIIVQDVTSVIDMISPLESHNHHEEGRGSVQDWKKGHGQLSLGVQRIRQGGDRCWKCWMCARQQADRGS